MLTMVKPIEAQGPGWSVAAQIMRCVSIDNCIHVVEKGMRSFTDNPAVRFRVGSCLQLIQALTATQG